MDFGAAVGANELTGSELGRGFFVVLNPRIPSISMSCRYGPDTWARADVLGYLPRIEGRASVKVTAMNRSVETRALLIRDGDADADGGEEDEAADDGEGDLPDTPGSLALDLAGAGVDEEAEDFFFIAVGADPDR